MTVREAMALEAKRKQDEKAKQRARLAELLAKEPELTDRDAAERMGLSPQTVYRWRVEARALAREASNALKISARREQDGRWIGEARGLPGVLAYGATRQAAVTATKALALRVAADRLEHGEPVPKSVGVLFAAVE